MDAEIVKLKAEIESLRIELMGRPTIDAVRRMDATAHHTQRIMTDIVTYNLLRRCLHPDSRNSASDDILHKAWLGFSNLEQITYDKSKIPPPLPDSLSDLWRMKMEATEKRKAARRKK
jgi:hypothetical protein